MTGLLLEVKGLQKSFGGLQVLTDVSLNLETGERVGLIGPNGAGKSTLIKIIGGFERADAGSVLLNGASIAGLRPHRICRLGVSQTFQHAEVFPSFTAMETLMVAAQLHHSTRAAGTRAKEVLTRLGIRDWVRPDTMTPRERGLLEVAKGIAANAQLMLLDEVLAGLSETEQDELMAVLLELSDEGVTMLMVEHNIPIIKRFSERVYALDHGVMVTSGPPDDVLRHDTVMASYLGV